MLLRARLPRGRLDARGDRRSGCRSVGVDGLATANSSARGLDDLADGLLGFKRIDRPILGYPHILSALARMTRMSQRGRADC